MKSVQLTKDLYWIGALDPQLRNFDIIMETEFGTSYNSYLIRGSEKTAIFETAKAKCFEEYLEKLTSLVPLSDIEYIVLDHTEPDHSGSIERLLDLSPKLKLVGSAAAINFMKEICNREFNSVVVKDGDILSLGDKTLQFISAPNLHWPDSIFTYIAEEQALMSCDSFGAHYASEGVTNDKIENQGDYEKALRYYFDNIMGPFKTEMLSGIKKIKDLDIKIICPGHGPVLIENPRKIVQTYEKWSNDINPNKKKTVVMAYVSAYGYTQLLANEIQKGIEEAGDIEVRSYDLVTEDKGIVLADMQWADGLLFGTPTIIGDALKPIWDLVTSMFAKTHGKKLASAFGSYGWSGEGVPNILERLKQLNMKVVGEGLRVRFKPSEAQLLEAFEFGYRFGASVMAGKVVEKREKGAVSYWKCLICGEIVMGSKPPEACPVCGVGPEQFVEVENPLTTYESREKQRFLIIGNGVAGVAAAEEIRKRNAVASIEMLSREDVPGYNRPMLTKGILSDIDALNFFMKPLAWYEENKITLTLSVAVTAIDEAAKKVILENGETRAYDKLILATGADSFVPPIKGVNQAGVFSIRTSRDIKSIQAVMKEACGVVIIGGGVLGLEAASEFCKAGLGVSVVEQSGALMGKQLDERASAILKRAAEKMGIHIYTGVKIDGIEGAEGQLTGVRLADDTLVEGSLVILSTGIKQNKELAQSVGIETTRSIVVDEKMETGKAGIYACGDCAEFKGVNYGIWSEALEMGKVAGINAVGDTASYEQGIAVNSFSGMKISLFALGDNGKEPNKKYKTLELYDEAKGNYEKLYFVNNRFCGGILMGDTKKSAELLRAYENQDSLEVMLKNGI